MKSYNLINLFDIFHEMFGLMGKRENGYKRALIFFLLLAYGGVNGCAPALSKQFRQQVGPPIPFQRLLEDTEAYKGARVILGGYILETVNEPDGSRLTMLQVPLDSRNEPKSQDLSKGRFLVKTEKFLDPEIYSKGRKLTVGGTISGVSPEPLGNLLYRYPVIKAEELHLWPKEERYTRDYYPYYYPWYYYPYYPYPWWAW